MPILYQLFPFLRWWPLVNADTLKSDLIAGLTGAVIVLPQGVAFATIAGLPPEYGLYTAMITPIIAALFGSSLHLISGPTTAISIVVFSSLHGHAAPGTEEYIQLALTLTLLAGIYQFVLGVARMGALVNFVSHTVVIGFTAGAAILIATSQFKYVLGLDVPRGESFFHTWQNILSQLGYTNHYVLIVAAVTLVVALAVKKWLPILPNLLIGMIAGSLTSLWLGGESEGIMLIGEVPSHLPPISSPLVSLETIKMLAPEALAIALLGLVEALSISRAVASRSGQQIDGNQEFIGQGLSNIVGSFFSSYAGSGSFTRSGVNYASGAKTPFSAIFSAMFLMLIIIFVAPLMSYLPVASMGAVILLVAYNLIDFHHIKEILKISKTETAILLTTFFATLFTELEFAIYLGVSLSLLLFLNRTSSPDIVPVAPNPNTKKSIFQSVQRQNLKECPQLKIIRIDMSVYFGSLTHIQKQLNHITDKEGFKHILILAEGINFIDLAGADMLAREAQRIKKLGGGLYFCGLKSKVCDFLDKNHFTSRVGEYNFFTAKNEAIEWIFTQLDKSVCARCEARIFKECASVPMEKKS